MTEEEELMISGKLLAKTAIVTGGSRGIGRAIATAFARQGANVVINYSKSAREAKETVKAIEKEEGTAMAIQADVSDKKAVAKMVHGTLGAFKGIDILVNNAGINIDRPLQQMTEKEWDRVIDVNLKGTFLCSQAVAEWMVAQKSGKIINIGAQTGIRGRKNGANYCASKAGIITLTRCQAYEFAPHVQVNCIIPGFIATDEVIERYRLHNKKNFNKMVASIPAGRLGLPEDVAEMALHLVSQANYVTGQLIWVNGGMVMY
jgi:3-oxoacyl-[acyl-carrier protein] reductase